MMHGWFSFMALIPCVTAIGFYLYSICAAADLFSQSPGKEAAVTPPVSVLKPLCQAEDATPGDLLSFVRQDAATLQILFGVSDPEDACVPIVRRIIHDFPYKDIRLVVCQEARGANPKAGNLAQMEPLARHPILLVSDGDIRLAPGDLSRIVQPLQDPRVGAVTCMARSRLNGFASTLEALRISTEFSPGVLAARRLEGVRFGLGSAIAIRQEALKRIGGFAAISDYLADDYQLGALVAKAGYEVVLSSTVVEHGFSRVSLRDVFLRQIRWNRGIRSCRPWSFFGLFLTQGIPMSMVFLLAAGGSAVGWAVLLLTWGTRFSMAHLIGARYLNDPAAKRFLWLVPLQDLVSFGAWCVSFLGNTIDWRGRRFTLSPSGKLIPAMDSLLASHPFERESKTDAPVAVANR